MVFKQVCCVSCWFYVKRLSNKTSHIVYRIVIFIELIMYDQIQLPLWIELDKQKHNSWKRTATFSKKSGLASVDVAHYFHLLFWWLFTFIFFLFKVKISMKAKHLFWKFWKLIHWPDKVRNDLYVFINTPHPMAWPWEAVGPFGKRAW